MIKTNTNKKINNSIFKKSVLVSLFLLILVFSQSPQKMEANVDLVPKPKLVETKGFKINLNKDWVIAVDTSDSQCYFSAKWLKEKLNESNLINLSILDLNSAPSSKRIILGTSQNKHLKELLEKRKLALPLYLGKEGYILEIFKDKVKEIIIAGHQPNGVFYGVQTLLQLISSDNSIEGVSIIDWPDHKIRAVQATQDKEGPGGPSLGSMLVMKGDPPQFSEEQKKAIEELAKLKINTLIYYQTRNTLDFFKESPKYWQAYQEMAEYCRERFIEFIPVLPYIKNILGVPPIEDIVPFYLIEGRAVEDERFKFNEEDLAEPIIPFKNLYQGNSVIVPPKDGRDHFYYLTAIAGKETASISLKAIGKYRYSQTDEGKNRKLGVTLRIDDNIDLIEIKITGNPTQIKLFRLNGALKNVIRTKTTDIKVTNLDKTLVYKEGLDYEIIPGETSYSFDESLKSFQIKRIPTGRISPGQEILVSYDFVTYYNRRKKYIITGCVCDERIYTEYFYPAIDKILKYIKPPMIYLVMDEIRGFNRDSRCKKMSLTNAELFARHINKLTRYIKSKCPHCQVMICDDQVSPYHFGGDEYDQLKYGGYPGKISEATEKEMIDKDVIMAVWWYGDHYLTQIESAIRYFTSKGYKIWGKIWYDKENIKSWSELLIDRKNYLGTVDCDWWWPKVIEKYPDYTAPGLQFPFFADHFWNTRYKVVYFDSFEEDKDKDGFPDGWYYTGSLESEPNLIQNASFENDLASWEIVKTNLNTPAIDTTTYHSGKKSIYFKSDGTGASTIKAGYIPIEPNTEYVLSAWAKGKKITTGEKSWHRLYLVGRFYDKNYQMLPTPECYADIYSFDTGTFDWKYFEHHYRSPSNAHYFRITSLGITGTGSGEAWIDNVVFQKFIPSAYSTNGKYCQGKRLAGFPNAAISAKGDTKIWYSRPIPVESNSEYVLSAYIKRNTEGKEKPRLKLVWLDSNGREISEDSKVLNNVTTEYQYYEMQTQSPTNASFVRIYLEGEKNGKEYFWFDTLRLKIKNKPFSYLKGDLNQDNKVNSLDFQILIQKFKETQNIEIEDLNSDGIVDVKDIGILMHYWKE